MGWITAWSTSSKIDMPDENGGTNWTPLKKLDKEPLSSTHSPSTTWMKYGSLVTQTTIHAASTLMIRYSQIRDGDKFLSSSAVVMAEVVKLALSLLLVLRDDGNLTGLYRTVVRQPRDTLKVCVPSMLFVVYNNLLFVGAQHLDATTFLVTNRLKILATAFFAVVMLKQTFRILQWQSLAVLISGVVLVQLAQSTESSVSEDLQDQQNRLLGFGALAVAALLSGFSCVYLEMILKGSDISVWTRNVQLSSLSLPLALASCVGYNWSQIRDHGFFFGYDWFVWSVILIHAGGGLTVAVVIKYADNMLKCFASSLSIVIASVASIFLFGLQVTWMFAGGVVMVIASVFMYHYHDLRCVQSPTVLPGGK